MTLSQEMTIRALALLLIFAFVDLIGSGHGLNPIRSRTMERRRPNLNPSKYLNPIWAFPRTTTLTMKSFLFASRPTLFSTAAAVALLSLFATDASVAEEEAEILYSFETPDSMLNWRSVNDGVMGGRSKGNFQYSERKTLLFTGDLSLEKGGGFASIRTEPSAMNLEGATGIIVRARGDGRTYRVQLRTDNRMATSYRVDLPTAKGGFSDVLIPFSDFKLQVFGNPVPGSKPIDPADVNSLGFSVADKKAGAFEFEIESVKIFRGDIKSTAEADGAKPLVQAAAFIENSRTIVSYQSPLPAKMAMMTEMNGPARMLNSSPAERTRIVRDNSGSVYVQQASTISVYDAEGREQRSLEIPPEVLSYVSFTVIPDDRIAFLDNSNDAIYFVDQNGTHLKTVPISDGPDRRIQNMRGIVVEDKLIVSENGYNILLSVDLTTYDLSVFLSLKQLKGWLGAIAYSDGMYYICQSRDIYSYNPELDEVLKVATAPRGNITGVAVENDQLIVAANGRGKRPVEDEAVYRIDLKSGEIAELKNAFSNPTGLMLLKPKEDMAVVEEVMPPLAMPKTKPAVKKDREMVNSTGESEPTQATYPADGLLGVWVNTDEDTGGITKIAIYEKNFTKYIHAFAACCPNDCNWGASVFHSLGDSIESTTLPYGFSTWDFQGKSVHATLKLDGEILSLTSHSIYTGGDFRDNHRSQYTFRRAEGDEAVFLTSAPLVPQRIASR